MRQRYQVGRESSTDEKRKREKEDTLTPSGAEGAGNENLLVELEQRMSHFECVCWAVFPRRRTFRSRIRRYHGARKDPKLPTHRPLR